VDALHHLANENPRLGEARDADTRVGARERQLGDSVNLLFSDRLRTRRWPHTPETRGRDRRRRLPATGVRTIIISSIVSRHERTRLGQLRQLRSPPVVSSKSVDRPRDRDCYLERVAPPLAATTRVIVGGEAQLRWVCERESRWQVYSFCYHVDKDKPVHARLARATHTRLFISLYSELEHRLREISLSWAGLPRKLTTRRSGSWWRASVWPKRRRSRTLSSALRWR